MIKKFLSPLLIITLITMTSGLLNPYIATAASISTAKATFGRLKESTASDSVIVQFVSPTGIQAGSDTITLTFSSDFVLAAESVNNFDVGLGNSGTCSSASYTDENISLTASATDWGVDVTGQVMTFSPETDDTLTAGYCIRIEMGTAATTGATGATNTVSNGLLDDDDSISIAGGFGDTGTIMIDIIDDDQVTVSATVNQTLTFDLDTAATDTESGAPYTVPLGVLSGGSVTRSGTASVNMIIAEGLTNASGGMNVTVKNANGVNGLVSTSTPADKIPSATGTMVAGTSNYGLCVATANLTGFTRATGYVSDTCALASGTNGVRALATTATDILTSTAPVSSGHAEIVVNAAISGSTPAHTDYTDTLTFVATASF